MIEDIKSGHQKFVFIFKEIGNLQYKTFSS
jgi:hypothetical protein